MTEPEPLPGIDGLHVMAQIAAFLPPEHQDEATTFSAGPDLGTGPAVQTNTETAPVLPTDVDSTDTEEEAP